MNYFPVFLDTRGIDVLFVGGTEAILAKLRLLLKTRARLIVVSADVDEEIARLAEAGRVIWHARDFEPADLIAKRIAYIFTGSTETDAMISHLARDAGLLVNVVDDPENSNIITPALVDRDPLVIAIGTEGAAPVLARQIKAELEARLSPRLGQLVAAAGQLRTRIALDAPSRLRRLLWGRFFSSEGERAHVAGEAELHAHFESLLADVDAPLKGRVLFVGAGPGDPELLTLKARKALHDADVVLHDWLVNPEILELARREAKIIEVGKPSGKDSPRNSSWQQADIEALMIAEAMAGFVVVRLKGGDVHDFVQTGSEISRLKDADIVFDIIPGLAKTQAINIASSLSQQGVA